MKKKTLVATLLSSALVVGTLVGVAVSKRKIAFSRTHADNYTLYAFDAYCDNPGSSVAMTTSLGNQIVLSTSGASVSGNKIALAPGGYLEVARDGTKENLNAIDGLTSIETDFEGRIAYSYRDQVATYDDAVDGTYNFPTEHAPSFFKLYNDSNETREVGSFDIKYNCVVSENSISPANKTYTVTDGVVTSSQTYTTFNLFEQTKKGILTYSCKKVDGTATMGYIGGVVGLSTNKETWYGKTSKSYYVRGAMNGKGQASLGAIAADDLAWFEGDEKARHTIQGFTANTFTTFTLKFDVDNQYYALYCGNQIMAVDTTAVATGSRLGFRITKDGDSVKNIIVQKNIDFKYEPLQRRAYNQLHVYNDGTTNVYSMNPAETNTWHYFQQQLPTTGTIQFDYSNTGGPSMWVEGVVFTDSMDTHSVFGGKSAIFGASGEWSNFSAVSCYPYESDETDPETGDPIIKHHPGWMTTRNAKFSYPLDGTVVHLKFVYDLSIPSWECYKRDTVDDEWVQTGTFSENAEDRDLTGLKYFGIRVADGHNGDSYAMSISNIIVNGVEY